MVEQKVEAGQCKIGNPDSTEGGTLLMTMTGTVAPTEIHLRVVTKVTGEGPTIDQIAGFLGGHQIEDWRWVRACAAGENPVRSSAQAEPGRA